MTVFWPLLAGRSQSLQTRGGSQRGAVLANTSRATGPPPLIVAPPDGGGGGGGTAATAAAARRSGQPPPDRHRLLLRPRRIPASARGEN